MSDSKNKEELVNVVDDKIYDNPKGKSAVWKYFGFCKKDGELVTNKCVCKLCKAVYKYTTSSTTALLNHNHAQHSEINLKTGLKNTKDRYQPTLFDTVNKTHKFSQSSSKSQALDNLVLRYLVKDMRPLSTSDSKYFQDMVKGLEPRYDLPHSTYFSNKLVKVYDIHANELKTKIGLQQKVGLTCDFWTSISCQSYLTVTAHFITDEWQLESPVLLTREIPESHTGENIASNLKSCITEWHIPTPFDLTIDNAANMISSANILKEEGLLNQHLPCLGHIINLTAKSGLEKKPSPEISHAIAKVRSAVKYFRKSPLAKTVLVKKQEALDIPKHAPILDVETRWNSTYDMLMRYTEQEPAIQAALLDPTVTKNSRGLLLDHDQAILLQDICKVLKPFKDATEHLSKEKNPTSPIILPTLSFLRTHLERNPDLESKSVKKFRSVMLNDFKSRYSSPELQKFIQIASLLDPRFKHLNFIDESERKLAKENLLNVLLMEKDIKIKQEPADDSNPPLPALEVGDEPAPKRVKTEDLDISDITCSSFLYDICIVKVEKPKSSEELVKGEIERYLSDNIDFGSDFDLLGWWKERISVYPRLARVARKYLCSPGTSVSSERLFSAAGNLVTKNELVSNQTM